ncbi:MAG: hypothetical protein IJ866_01875 [Alphaproteobacteria bacterium]|nr:hypothetical protein [Alphaproteobacteria bacterium]
MSKPLFLLMALAVGPAFAADGVVASRVIPGNLSEKAVSNDTTARTTTRATAAAGRGTVAESVDAATRTTVARTTSRANVSSLSRGTATRNATSSGATTKSRATGDINENPVVRRAGVVLRPSFADYGGRATIAGTDRQTGSNISTDIQKVAGRATKQVQATKESITEAKEKLEQTAELNKSCQEQYNECMDQFCAAVDANQKRCSCSANLSKYAKVEKAATEANRKLNEVAQAIRYVGLSADEIRAIMTETEAEEALNGTTDTSTTRNMLKQIESMIKDPTSNTTSYSSETNFGLDMDLTFSSEPTDIFSLDFLNLGSNTSSISNLRGTELYNTARRRCSTILNSCKNAGATQAQITGNYDLAIDRDCVAYEAGLKKMNETLVSNVNSANLMLQKARLAVLQNKNQYDAKGCVAALETCMKDDMVCGDNYYKCVDPTKAYIDENGEVVLGQDITVIQSFMTEYNNSAINSAFLQSAYGSETQIGTNTCANDGKCVIKYLLQKIGTKEKATDEGLCRPVLDKCQYYTYDSNKKYKQYNDIVVNYVQRAMVNIKAAQQKIISEYASSCIADVAACYNSQITQVNSWASAASTTNIYSVMRGACRSVALTCGFALFTGEPTIKPYDDLPVGDKTYHVSQCTAAGSQTYGTAGYNDAIINCVSDMFYQSLLCPDNSTYTSTAGTIATNGDAGYVNTQCVCNSGYVAWSGACVAACGDHMTHSLYGTCVCNDGYTMKNGVCSASDNLGGGIAENPSNSGDSSDSSSDDSSGEITTSCPLSSTIATYDASCTATTSGLAGCAQKYCRCKNSYTVSGTTCVPYTPASACSAVMGDRALRTEDSSCTESDIVAGTLNGCTAVGCRCTDDSYVYNAHGEGTVGGGCAYSYVANQITQTLNAETSQLSATVSASNANASLIQTVDGICLLYAMSGNDSEFVGVADCDTDITAL